MNQFVAPQFIDVEDRILGPITVRQFVMIVIGGVISFASYKLLDSGAFALVTLLTMIAVVVFGFLKVNGKHFDPFVSSMITALKRPKVRVWRKEVTPKDMLSFKEKESGEKVKSDFTPRKATISSKHLAELALLVDTGGKYDG
ncbi:MAG: PrgI family protein [Candidatus Kuenenbacteria bacterium]